MGMFVVAPATSFYEHPHLVQHHQHQQHQNQHHGSGFMTHEGNNPATALGVGVGVIPLLTAVDDQDIIGRSRAAAAAAGAMHLWQNQQHHQQQQQQLGGGGGFNTPPKKSINFDSSGLGSSLIPSSSGMSGGTATCQDCGNQAKKDCSHRRCRTCCRSRGFDCSTHVKSTWVPAARRRERQMVPSGTGVVGGGGGASSGSTSGAKKPRLISSQTTSHTSTSNTPPRSFETSSSHQDASFKEALPGQVRAPAMFKCVKVTAVDDGEDEFAYQAVVKIGGHVFKGFLYDQGVEQRDGFPNMSELHLGGGASTSGGGAGGGGGRNGSPSPVLDPSDVYGPSRGGGLLGGSSYGNTIN